MSIFFCSDLHFGHNRIERFRHFVSNEGDNRNRIVESWDKLVTKRDDVYVLGDACFTRATLHTFAKLKGRKFLIRGNHDRLDTSEYLQYFDSVEGLYKYKEFWLSHAPIHPDELRGRVNLHGHVHYATLNDKRYFNCCVENIFALTGECLISLDKVREILSDS